MQTSLAFSTPTPTPRIRDRGSEHTYWVKRDMHLREKRGAHTGQRPSLEEHDHHSYTNNQHYHNAMKNEVYTTSFNLESEDYSTKVGISHQRPV